jgi:hypothetical protein
MSDTYHEEKSWIRSNLRHIIFLSVIGIGLITWNIHVNNNSQGYLRGIVVDAVGRPVQGAQVELQEKTINLLKPPLIERTDEEGRFEYTDLEIIEFVISARKVGVGASQRQRHHLYFKGQNYTIEEPLVLIPQAEQEDAGSYE